MENHRRVRWRSYGCAAHRPEQYRRRRNRGNCNQRPVPAGGWRSIPRRQLPRLDFGSRRSDEADGQSDRIVDAAHIADQPTSWKISNGRSQRGIWADKPIASLAGTDGSIGWIVAGSDLLSVRNLTTIDAADGLADGILDMTQVIGQPDSWRFGVHQLTPVGDTDGDGVPDLVGVFHGHRGATAYLFSPTQLAGADTVNDGPDGEIWDSELENMTGAWTILESRKFRLPGVSIAGDVDRDGLVDLLLGYPGESTDRLPGSVYLVLAADLAALDRVDSIINRRLNLQDLAGDTDADGLLDTTDRDDDGDGVPDWADAFQLDPDEWPTRTPTVSATTPMRFRSIGPNSLTPTQTAWAIDPTTTTTETASPTAMIVIRSTRTTTGPRIGTTTMTTTMAFQTFSMRFRSTSRSPRYRWRRHRQQCRYRRRRRWRS